MSEDKITATVTGTIGRTGQAKNGPYAVIEVARQGSQFPDRVTAWGINAASGDRVTVSGYLSWRKNERDGKVYVDVSLNQPKLDKHEPATTQAGYGDDSPF